VPGFSQYACGYEDGDDLDRFAQRPDVQARLRAAARHRSRSVLATYRLALGERALVRDLIRLMRVMVDLYCASYPAPPAAVDARPPPSQGQAIDDTVDVVHGHQQLSFFNAHYDERCFLPIHVYDTATARPVAVLLRPGKTPSGKEVRGHLRRLVRRIRKPWPQTHITIRGEGHYSRSRTPERTSHSGIRKDSETLQRSLPAIGILANSATWHAHLAMLTFRTRDVDKLRRIEPFLPSG